MLAKKDNFAGFFVLYFLVAFLGIVSLSGCSPNIPSAATLVSGEVTLTWDGVSEAISYNIYGATSPGVNKFSGVKFRNVTNPFTLSKLEPGKTYYFIVTMVNEHGESEKSKELSYTAVAGKTGLLDFKNFIKKPLAKRVSTTPEKGSVTLTWKGVPDAISYNIYLSTSPGVTKLNGQKISNAKNPQKIVGLKPGTTYYFVVTALNEAGESEESEEMSFTTE
jgi:fibronectin type 3 domain-containing protein